MPSKKSSDFKLLHRIIRGISGMAASSFFTEVRVIGGEKVPKTGPIIVTATHHNMMLDPVILSVAFPYGRILNYWSKATLFGNPIVAWILYSSGNIPVDRKSKDRQTLFKGTFEALARGEAVALFPEGTSYTEPRIMQIKDGAAWSALEYTKWLKEHPEVDQTDVTIIPAAIVYTNKSKYRSSVIMEFGNPLKMDPYKEQFLSNIEGAPRAAVKRLTRALEHELLEATVNAPDWDTLYAARMARDLMWEKDRAIPLDDFVVISQTLVDLFSTEYVRDNFKSVTRTLLEYYSLLQSTHLTNSVLSALPLPRSLDPNVAATLPSRLYTLFTLIKDTFGVLIRVPFFIFPLIVHSPVYIMGKFGARLVEDEEETQAQNKVAFGLLSLLLIYPATFFFLWALFWYTPFGALLAFGTVYLFATYHNRMINDNYESAKRLVAAWRVLVGVWAPKRLEFSLAALSPYTTPVLPKENPWIDRPKPTPNPSSTAVPTARSVKFEEKDSKSINSSTNSSTPSITTLGVGAGEEPPVKTKPLRRPPSRRIMRHVLRARVEAVKALASFFAQLEKAGNGSSGTKPLEVVASLHLARRYGRIEHVSLTNFVHVDESGADESMGVDENMRGWRHAKEVISFLKERGAKIPKLGHEGMEEEWAALTSDAEGSG